jgi:hypothetical protein
MMRKSTFFLKFQAFLTLSSLFITLKTCFSLNCRMAKNPFSRLIKLLKEPTLALKKSNQKATDIIGTIRVPIFMLRIKKRLLEARTCARRENFLTQLSILVVNNRSILLKLKTFWLASNHSSLKIRDTTICSSWSDNRFQGD